MVYLFTGDGKGKTSAAVGVGIRALGHGKKVVMVQFMKSRPSGEINILKGLRNFDIYRFGRKEFVKFIKPEKEDIDEAKKALEKAKEEMKKRPFLLILDEINVAVGAGLISVDEVLNLLDELPDKTNVILTGRYAPPQLIERADLVTNMVEVKHPFQKGIPAIEGLDY